MELIKRSISADRITADETVQFMLEGEIIVPDTKGDIDRLISQSAKCFVTPGEISGERINFGGTADIDIIYLNRAGAVEGMSGSCRLNDFIVAQGVSPDSAVQLFCNTAELECSTVNERKVAYKVLVEIRAVVYDTYSTEAAEGIEGLAEDNMFVKDIAYTNLLSKKPSYITIKEQIKIDRDKPNIDSVAELRVSPVNIAAETRYDGVCISGDLKLTLLYNSEEGGNPLEVYTDEIPLNGGIEVIGAEEGMVCCPDICPENVYYSVLADEDGENRVLEVECELRVYPNVYENINVRLLDDAYCLDKLLELDKCEVRAFRTVCCNKSQCPVKQPIETDGADMLQIYCASGSVIVDNVSVRCDKTLVEGVLRVNVLYVTGSDADPVCGFSGDIPFEHTLETVGSREGMSAFVTAAPQHIGFNMLSQREVEIRGMLSVNCVVNEDVAFTAVTGAEAGPLPAGLLDRLPSITVYIVKKGDTLWKLAKRFNTTVKDIAAVNDLEDPDLIFPGQKLMILKGVAWEG